MALARKVALRPVYNTIRLAQRKGKWVRQTREPYTRYKWPFYFFVVLTCIDEHILESPGWSGRYVAAIQVAGWRWINPQKLGRVLESTGLSQRDWDDMSDESRSAACRDAEFFAEIYSIRHNCKRFLEVTLRDKLEFLFLIPGRMTRELNKPQTYAGPSGWRCLREGFVWP